VPNVAGCDKDCRWRIISLEHPLGIMEVIGIPIIKGDDYRTIRQSTVFKSVNKLLQMYDSSVLSKRLKMLSEVGRGDAQGPGVWHGFRYAMIK
jgi:hypothetical protein